jgi:hypothetical protein
MTNRLAGVVIAFVLGILTGCGGDSKNVDPKPAPGTKEDPRLQPAVRQNPGNPKDQPPSSGSPKIGGPVSQP